MPNFTPESLRDLLLPLLETAATAVGTHTWQAQTDAANASDATTSPSVGVSSTDRLAAVLTLSGALSGCLTLTIDRSSAAYLQGTAPDLDQAWLSFARTVADRFCPAVSAITGSVTLRDCRLAESSLRTNPLLAPVTLRSFDEHTALTIVITADDALLAHLRPSTQPTSDGPLQTSGPLHRVIDVPLAVSLRFGQRHLTLREVLELNTGSLLELDRQVEEPVDLVLGDRVIARGEVMIIDGNYGMRVTEVLETSTASRPSASALRYGNA